MENVTVVVEVVHNWLANVDLVLLYRTSRQEQITWMIDHPDASKDEGREFVKTRFAEFC